LEFPKTLYYYTIIVTVHNGFSVRWQGFQNEVAKFPDRNFRWYRLSRLVH